MRTIVVPGLRLGERDDKHISGPGTYLMHGYIYSSQVGELMLIHTQNNTVSVEVGKLFKFKCFDYILFDFIENTS